MLVTSGVRTNSRTAPAMSPTPQPPPETSTMRPVLGQPELAPRLGRAARLEELGRDQRAHEPHAALAGDALDRRHRLAVHDEVHVDPGLRPEEQARQVGDRRDRRAGDLAAPPQPRQHDRHRRICGDDDVGFVFADRAGERARAERAEQPPRHPAHRQHVLEQPVDDRVAPRHHAELDAVSVLDHRAQHAAHRVESVDHRHLGLFGRGLDLLRHRAGRRGVPLADVGGQDQHALRAVLLAEQAKVALAFVPSHHRNCTPHRGLGYSARTVLSARRPWL